MLAVGEMAMAVVDRVAAAVGGHEQRVLPFGVEQRRQRVGEVMVVEIDARVVAQPEIALERRHVEKILHGRRVGAQRLARDPALRLAFDIGAPLLAHPAPAAKMVEIFDGIIGAADG